MKKSTISICAIALVFSFLWQLPDASDLRTSPEGLELIARFESCSTTAYRCPAGIWTGGIGHTQNVKENDSFTTEKVAQFLIDDVKQAENCINQHLNGKNAPQSVFDGLVSLVFNVGCETAIMNKVAHRPTWLAIHARNGNWMKVCARILDFDKSKGKVLKGLKLRRQTEEKHCIRDAAQ